MEKNRQKIVCDYIEDNFVQYDRLRHDLISNKVQINDGLSRADGLNDGLLTARWRDITTTDINDIVCDCSAESGLQITAREVLAVLQSHRIPDIHPLREYVLNCRPYTDDQPDWIGWLAERVTVEGGEAEQQQWRTCFTKWFVAMVACWMKDEVVNQQVLVLIGRQGIFKTTWLEHLLPPELRAYGCKMANSAQENEEQLLAVYFDIPAEGKGQFMTTAEISDKLVTMGSIKRPMPLNRLGMLLKKAGYKDTRRGPQRIRGWYVYERTSDEINANRNKKEPDDQLIYYNTHTRTCVK